MILKRVFSICLLISMAYPTLASVRHALTEHIERHCQDDIPNHFHSSESTCDFDQYHRDLLYQQHLPETEWFADGPFADSPASRNPVYHRDYTNHKNSRAPPPYLM